MVINKHDVFLKNDIKEDMNMPVISLRTVDNDNFDLVVKLSETLSDYQKKCVAPNMVSLAQAYVNIDHAWPKAIYQDEEVVGFVMLSLFDPDIPKEDWPAYYLWRFMMAKDHQQKGYGKQVLDLIVDKCRKDGIRYLYTSCEIEGEQPYGFYIKYGFIDTKENDGEQILKLKI
jgi:diamine N-acetyltransferase